MEFGPPGVGGGTGDAGLLSRIRVRGGQLRDPLIEFAAARVVVGRERHLIFAEGFQLFDAAGEFVALLVQTDEPRLRGGPVGFGFAAGRLRIGHRAPQRVHLRERVRRGVDELPNRLSRARAILFQRLHLRAQRPKFGPAAQESLRSGASHVDAPPPILSAPLGIHPRVRARREFAARGDPDARQQRLHPSRTGTLGVDVSHERRVGLRGPRQRPGIEREHQDAALSAAPFEPCLDRLDRGPVAHDDAVKVGAEMRLDRGCPVGGSLHELRQRAVEAGDRVPVLQQFGDGLREQRARPYQRPETRSAGARGGEAALQVGRFLAGSAQRRVP